MLIKSPLIAQDEKIDSLRLQLNKSANDTSKVNLLVSLSMSNSRSSPNEAISFGMEAKNLAEQLNFKTGEALALKYIGMAYFFQSQYLETIQFWQQSLDVFEAIGDDRGVANMLGNIGVIYFNQGDDAKAIEFYLKTLKVADEIGDSLRMATVLNNIGAVYFNKMATQDKALNYYLRAYKISRQIRNLDAIGTSAVNAGGYYLEKKNADSALFYFNISLDALMQSTTGDVSYVLHSIGSAYAVKKDFSQAKEYLNEALSLARENNNSLNMTLSLIALGNTMTEEKDFKTAIDYYKQAEVLAREIGVNYQLETTFESLARSYATISEFEQAYQYQKLFSGIKDTLYNAENDKKIQRLQFNYDISKKQQEVNILTKDKELQALEVRRQKVVKNAFLFGFLLILVIAFILYRNIKSKIRINSILDKQNIKIEKLLLNILPEEIAEELQLIGLATPRNYESVSILFTDFKGFSNIAKDLQPGALVSELNSFFIAFDRIMEKFNMEKIKTIGDAYMCAGGIPTGNSTHPIDAVRTGLEMQKFMRENNEKRKLLGKIPWELRVGIHTGPVVAGVVGEKKFAYDIWGSAVNISSRMESNGEAGEVNISASTYELINDKYICKPRGKIYAKNIGEIEMYFVESEISKDHKKEKELVTV
jgi:adenylate cyclase